MPLPSDVLSEWCFYVETDGELSEKERDILYWLLAETYEPQQFGERSFVATQTSTIVEIGPRLNFETAWSTTAVAICRACGINAITRLERSRRYGFLTDAQDSHRVQRFILAHMDRMTEVVYETPLTSFASGAQKTPVRIIPFLNERKDALRRLNVELGLSMDEQDIEYYDDLFFQKLKRDTNDVELPQLGQSNSEHSRHGFFKGKHVIDGTVLPDTLMQIVQQPLHANPGNSDVAFGNDSSSIHGFMVRMLLPSHAGAASNFKIVCRTLNPTLTAETHNHPTAIEPYQGAATGIGGMLRDLIVMMRGGLITATGAGYCTSNLRIPGYALPWEQDDWQHPSRLASPLDILIKGSNGISEYGNRFGKPLIYGFTRTFGADVSGEYRGWFKPILYAVGTGVYDASQAELEEPKKGMLVVQLGGPGYRIGVGGGSASSLTAGANTAELDFASVQRGDAYMEQLLYRVGCACVELKDKNPIVDQVDLGAGGLANGVPELVYPAGARLELGSIPVGDATLSTAEVWINESQERNAFLIWPEHVDVFQQICEREGTPCAIIGRVTGDGFIILHDENDGTEPVCLPLQEILGNLPQKTFFDFTEEKQLTPIQFPEGLTVRDALDWVLRLPSVASKRFLTTKVDRSVGGLVAQQQCVGPNHITLSDYGLVAHSHFALSGTALSLGEQPIAGLISPEAMARLAVAESMLNLCGVKITKRSDIKYSGNWMLAAKEPGMAAELFRAAYALRDMLIALGIAIDGGKDSLTMAARTTGPDNQEQLVKAPSELVLAAYAPVENITHKTTPDFKNSGNTIIYVDCSDGKKRLGGSALAQALGQLGNECPDVDDVTRLAKAFDKAQALVATRFARSFHDISDGGLITALLEMAFAGNVGVQVRISSAHGVFETLFSQEPGLLIETDFKNIVLEQLLGAGLTASVIGTVGDKNGDIAVRVNGQLVLSEAMTTLRSIWEETSFQLDALQADPACVDEERRHAATLVADPPYRLSFSISKPPPFLETRRDEPKLAVLREKGTNGDREMAAAFFAAGFDVYDVLMKDLIDGSVSLDEFQGLALPGGFSYGDILDAGKGWAGVITFNKSLAEQFQNFYERSNTFSFGVCNGCQLMALLGWIPWNTENVHERCRFIRNDSGRFESRFSAVRIEANPSIMLAGMAESILGVWVAHGEGRFYTPNQDVLSSIEEQHLVALRYVNVSGNATQAYPCNPNRSLNAIAGVCSADGRHLAMMPHPERTFQLWQWPWLPTDWRDMHSSPWMHMFRNAYIWSKERA